MAGIRWLQLVWMVVVVQSTIAAQPKSAIPSVDEVAKLFPRLATSDEALQNFSLRLQKHEVIFDIAWVRGGSPTALVRTTYGDSPIALLAEDKLLINDLQHQTLWLLNFKRPIFQLSVTDDGSYGFFFVTAGHEEFEGKEYGDELLIDLPEMVKGNWGEASVESSAENHYKIEYRGFNGQPSTLTSQAPFEIQTCTFANLNVKVDPPELMLRVSMLQVNSNHVSPWGIPSREKLELLTTINGGKLELAGGSSLEKFGFFVEKAPPKLGDLQQAFMNVLSVKGGLVNSKYRKSMNNLRYFDWEAAKKYDDKVSPKLLSLIEAASEPLPLSGH